jgi:hypothetical protein
MTRRARADRREPIRGKEYGTRIRANREPTVRFQGGTSIGRGLGKGNGPFQGTPQCVVFWFAAGIWSRRSQMRGFHDLFEGEAIFPINVVRMELISIAFLMIRSMYLDILAKILVLCMIAQVSAVFSYGGLLRMGETDMSLMFLDPRVN